MDRNMVRTIMKMVAAALLFCFALWNLPTFFHIIGNILVLLSPFLIGFCLAFILNVPLNLWEQKALKKVKIAARAKRVIGILLTLFCVILVIFLVIWLVVPQLVEAGESIGRQIPAAIERAEAFAHENVKDDTQIGILLTQLGANSEKLFAQMTDYIKDSSANILSTTVNVVSGTFGILVNFFMGLIFAIYILAGKEKLSGQCEQVIRAFLPQRAAKRIFYVCALTNQTFQKFITGQCLESVILGTIFFVVLNIFRMPYILPICIFIMLASLIPIVGSFMACIVGTLLILVVNPVQALGFLVLFLVIQQIDGNLIYPHVVGNSVGLPSIWVFAAVLIGGKLFGVVGMIVFIPLCSVIYVLFRSEVKKRLQKKEKQI